MFKSTATKIFFLFGLISLAQLAVAGYFFGRIVVRETETFLLDSLSRRSQLTAAMIQNELNKKIPLERILKDNSALLVTSEGQVLGQTLEKFDSHYLLGLVGPNQSVVTSCTSSTGTLSYCALSFIPSLKAWTLDIVRPVSSIEIMRRLSQEMLALALGLLMTALLLSYLLSRWALRPLAQFARASRLVSQGKYDQIELPLDRRDEIGFMAQSFARMMNELKEREKKVAHSARLATMGQMGASIAHEVKNPLMAMMGHAKILLNATQDPATKEAAEIIAKESDRCSQILSQMLRFTRNDSVESKPYSLKDVLTSTLSLAQAESKRSQIQLDFHATADPVIVGHAQQIQQVVLNLVMNAVHASKEAVAQGRDLAHQVHIRLHAESNWAHIEIEDHAMGIPENIRDRIFEPFFTTKDKREGTGLGLSVALDLVTEQGGTLTFSTGPQGTTFQIRLPLTAAA